MKKALFLLTALLLSLAADAQFDSAPAFPGAEGFGRYTTGGRGGAVYHVTRLDDDTKPGSFRYACNQSGKRTIVFDVSGTIYLKSELKLKNGNVSILGQTAPGDGICIADYPFTISSNNVIIRYMRFRIGDRNVAYHEGDGLGGTDLANIIIDHCSVSWSVDECLSVYGSKNTTVQWCFVDQSMVDCGHSKGNHGYGGNWGGSGASYHHNLIAHHTSRTPRLGPRQSTQQDERMDMRNNVIYNWGGNGCYGGEGMNVNIVNNFYKPGPGSYEGTKGMRIAAVGIRTSEYTKHDTPSPNGWDVMWHVWGKYYVTGNVNSKYEEVTNDNWTYGMYNQVDASGNDGTYTEVTKDTIRINQPIPYGFVTTHNAYKAFEKVVAYGGASYKRDSHDTDIADDVNNGTAKYTGSGNKPGFINSQDDAGGWPVLNSETAPADSDGDGMPDAWETEHGLNPTNANDANLYNLDSHRYYTNLEVYCNSLVEHIVKAQNADADASVDGAFEEYFPDMKNGESEVSTESKLYYHPDNGSANLITFEDGATLQITGNLDKTLASASDITIGVEAHKSIKLSNGAEMTFTCPEGKYAVGVTFYSYINKDEGATDLRTSFWASVDEQTYTADNATILKSYKDGKNPDTVSFTIGGKPAFKFCNSGDQLCFLMDVAYGNPAGITAIENDVQPDRTTYNIMGQRVTDSTRGIVIRNGKKYIVR